jgi:hypothetical protein
MVIKTIRAVFVFPVLSMLLYLCLLSPLCLSSSRLYSAPRSIKVVSDVSDPAPSSVTESAAASIFDPDPSLVPTIDYVLPEEHTSDKRERDRNEAQGEGGRWRFGTFVINNPGSGFILQVTFANGGVLRHKAGASIRLTKLVLIYRNSGPSRETCVIPLNYKGSGYVCEVPFRVEDNNVQEVYEMELWGGLEPGDFGKARAGPYHETAGFSVEVIF